MKLICERFTIGEHTRGKKIIGKFMNLGGTLEP